MAKSKLKYNVKGVERGGRAVVKPGLYTGKIIEVEEGVSKAGNDQLTVHLQIQTKGEFKGVKLRTWIGLAEASAWKLAELVDAIGAKENGTLDQLIKKAKGSVIEFRVEADTYNDQPTSRVGSLFPLDSGDDEDDDEEDDDDDDDDEEEEEDDEDESDDDDEEDDDESDDDDDDDDDDEEEEEEEEDEEPVDYKSLKLPEVVDLAKQRGLKATVKKGGELLKGAALKKALIVKLEKQDAENDDPFS